MKKRTPHSKRLTKAKVKEAYRLQKRFYLTSHARQRMDNRNITTKDIENILRYAYAIDRHDTGGHGDPTARLIGETVKGEWASIAVTLDKQYRVVILTVMDDDRQVD